MKKINLLSILLFVCVLAFTNCKKEDPPEGTSTTATTTGTLLFYVRSEHYNDNSGAFEYGAITGATVALSNSLSDAENEIYTATQTSNSTGDVSFENTKHGKVYYTVRVENTQANYGLISVLTFAASSGKTTVTVPYE